MHRVMASVAPGNRPIFLSYENVESTGISKYPYLHLHVYLYEYFFVLDIHFQKVLFFVILTVACIAPLLILPIIL
jgi:hypothetical protein